MREVSPTTRSVIEQPGADDEKIYKMLASHCPLDWAAFGKYVARLRQLRRRIRKSLESLATKSRKGNFAARKAAWKMRGGFVCDHGVFFNKSQSRPCPCMQGATVSAWQHARFMACLDERTKTLSTR
eukprot:7681808-Karenia_brevis.AAC.1